MPRFSVPTIVGGPTHPYHCPIGPGGVAPQAIADLPPPILGKNFPKYRLTNLMVQQPIYTPISHTHLELYFIHVFACSIVELERATISGLIGV